ncbi:hypothetical protein [Microbacterium sp.]|uniref:hypothetical protein n=1 Tax=Microbacterium sp. TaxID=51671 RepID=UPI002613B135|nr:hypothetical protein [Microbacterium sp.]
MTKDAKGQNALRGQQHDLLYGVGWALIASGFVLYDSIRRILELFSTPGAISARSPLPPQQIEAGVGSGVSAVMDSAVLIVPGVNTVSIVCLVLSIALGAVGLIGAAVLVAALCVRLLRGSVFDRINIRLLAAISLSLTGAALCTMAFRTMGLNGVFAAVGGSFDEQRQLFFEQLPLFGVAFAVAVLIVVFRRGALLQKETEGLV